MKHINITSGETADLSVSLAGAPEDVTVVYETSGNQGLGTVSGEGVFTPAEGESGTTLIRAKRSDTNALLQTFVVSVAKLPEAADEAAGGATAESAAEEEASPPIVMAPLVGAYDPATGRLPISLAYPSDPKHGLAGARLTIMVDGLVDPSFNDVPLAATQTSVAYAIAQGAQPKKVRVILNATNRKGVTAGQYTAVTVPGASKFQAPLATVSAPTEGQIKLTWPQDAENPAGPTAYEYSLDGQSWVPVGEEREFTLSGEHGDRGSVQVRAIQANGSATPEQLYVFKYGQGVEYTQGPRSLPAPCVSVVASEAGAVTAGWPTVPGATGYEVSTDHGATWTPTTLASRKVSGTPGAAYRLKVRAIDGKGNPSGNAASLTGTLPEA